MDDPMSDPLVANVRALLAHDLKNPLSAAWTIAALMEEMDDGSDPMATRNVEIVRSAVTRAITWIDDFTLTLELETGQRAIAPVPTRVEEVVARAREGSFQDVDRIGWPESPGAEFMGDADVLSRGLYALVSNALLHGGKDRPISVISRSEEDVVAFEVRDHGDGVAPDRRDRLFVSLRSAERSERRIGGIGLAVCRAVAEAHGGSVGYAPGESIGSRFWMRIPVGEPVSP